MFAVFSSAIRKTWRTAASVEAGVVALMALGILSAVGTIILQRPLTDPIEMQSAYSPFTLRILDSVGLTDVFHSWWYLALAGLAVFCVVSAAFDRIPGRWLFFSSPHKYPDETLRHDLRLQRVLPVADREATEEACVTVAEDALRSLGYNPERIVGENHFAVFVERHRASELAVFILYFSLLLVLMGVVVNGVWGWRGALNLNEGQSSNVVVKRDGASHTLPFAIRFDSALLESSEGNAQATIRSRLSVLREGIAVRTRDVGLNQPLVYRGISFDPSHFGPNGKVERLVLLASSRTGSGPSLPVALAVGDVVQLDADTTVRFAEFFPDYTVRDGKVYRESNEVRRPVAHLVVHSNLAPRDFDVWQPQLDLVGDNSRAPWQFQAKEMKAGYFTGLDVSFVPGRHAFWAGGVLFLVGLAFEFYLVHIRFWVTPVRDPRSHRLSLWIGGSANHNQEAFEKRFIDLVASIESRIHSVPAVCEDRARVSVLK